MYGEKGLPLALLCFTLKLLLQFCSSLYCSFFPSRGILPYLSDFLFVGPVVFFKALWSLLAFL